MMMLGMIDFGHRVVAIAAADANDNMDLRKEESAGINNRQDGTKGDEEDIRMDNEDESADRAGQNKVADAKQHIRCLSLQSISDERTRLLTTSGPSSTARRNFWVPTTTSRPIRWWTRSVSVGFALCGLVLLLPLVALLLASSSSSFREGDSSPRLKQGWDIPILSSVRKVAPDTITTDVSASSLLQAVLPEPALRCAWVEGMFEERDGSDPPGSTRLKETYAAQSTDFNVFYRATAHIFWSDYATGPWGDYTRAVLDDLEIRLSPDVPLSPKSTWTWVTGDQHLSNFGAWKNRHGDVVFGVNDFDEAAIYDFHIDVLRIAVSIHNHARANGLDDRATRRTIRAFTDSYVNTVLSYVDNSDAELFELTPQTAYGELQKFLIKLERGNSKLDKFTDTDPTTGLPFFLKGTAAAPHPITRLAAVPPAVEQKVRVAFNATGYGATMMKLGWNVREWDDDYFSVVDVSARVGSGIGSFGVDRYYVLLKGTDSLLEVTNDGSAVILDVKFEPEGAVDRILSAQDLAWYGNIFKSPADRAVQGQRRLTSFVDPFTGWISLDDDNDGTNKDYVVRQRSPWKEGFNLALLSDPQEFRDFAEQIAMSTATSHVRGSVAKAPAEFKNVIDAIMLNTHDRNEWGQGVENFAQAYHQQVLLDYQCFCEFIEHKYGIQVHPSSEKAAV
jgi:uncharacterized protein (DUF2252 family)